MDSDSDSDSELKAAAEEGRWRVRHMSADSILIHNILLTDAFHDAREKYGTERWMMTCPAVLYIREQLGWKDVFPVSRIEAPYRFRAGDKVPVSFIENIEVRNARENWTYDRVFQLSCNIEKHDAMENRLKELYAKLDPEKIVFPLERLETGYMVVVVWGCDIYRARVVGTRKYGERTFVLVDYIDIGFRNSRVLSNRVTFLFQKFCIPPRAYNFKMKGISHYQDTETSCRLLSRSSGIWEGQLTACKSSNNKDDDDDPEAVWTMYSDIITPQARPSGINELIVQRVREDRFRRLTYRFKAKDGTTCVINAKEGQITFAPISKRRSSEELVGLTTKECIRYRITKAQRETVWVHPDCFTRLLVRIEKQLNQIFDLTPPSFIYVMIGEAYMVRWQGKVYRALAMKTDEQGIIAGDLNMFLVDYARVEVIKQRYIRLLPKEHRTLVCCAVVAHLMAMNGVDRFLLDDHSTGGRMNEDDFIVGRIVGKKEASEEGKKRRRDISSWRERTPTQVKLLVKDFHKAGPINGFGYARQW